MNLGSRPRALALLAVGLLFSAVLPGDTPQTVIRTSLTDQGLTLAIDMPARIREGTASLVCDSLDANNVPTGPAVTRPAAVTRGSHLTATFSPADLHASTAVRCRVTGLQTDPPIAPLPAVEADLTLFNKWADAKAEISKLRRDLEVATRGLEAKTQEIEALATRARVSTLEVVEHHALGDSSATALIRCDKPGRLKVTLTAPGQAPKIFRSVDTDTDHYVLFSPLQPATHYTATVVPLDPTRNWAELSQPTASLSFDTLARENPVVVTAAVSKVSSRELTLHLTATRDAFVDVAYAPLTTDGQTRRVGAAAAIATFPRDLYKLPAGTGFTGQREIVIGSLSPGTEYKITVAAVDKQGRPAVAELGVPLSDIVASTDPEFDFADSEPVDMSVSPLGFDVKWSATGAAEKAGVEAQIKNIVLVKGASKAAGKTPEVAVEAAQVKGILASDAFGKEIPIIHIWMENAHGLRRDRYLRFGVKVPTKAEINSSTLDANEKKELGDLADKAHSNGKLTWGGVVKLVLGIAATFLK